MQVLVIDDELEICQMVHKMLSLEGHTVHLANNGNEGLKVLEENPLIDLIITDILMPEKEGFMTIKDIRKQYEKKKIIAISGGGSVDPSSYLNVARRIGAHSTLSKPFVKKELIASIEKALAN